MFILVTGGSKCGKSATAENLFNDFRYRKFYIATMIPYGDEAEKAVERHRRMRMGKGFETIEKYTDINDMNIPENCGILLECIGNLCANEMFDNILENPVEKITENIKYLSEKSELFVAVTSEVGSDGTEYSPETMEYISNLGKINCNLASLADVVIECVYGIPVLIKGDVKLC